MVGKLAHALRHPAVHPLLAVGIGLFLGLTFAEVALRLFRLAPARGVATVTEDEFVKLPGLFRPNQQLTDWGNRALPYTVRIDSLGYRGDDFPRTKPAGEFRILMIGDSFTYGDFVDGHETLPAQLGLALDRLCGSTLVINAGVGGTTIVTHTALALRSLILQPDLVVLTFSENDVDDLAAPMWYGLESNRHVKSTFPMSAIYPVLSRTALWNLALRVRARWSTARREDSTVGSSLTDDSGFAPTVGPRQRYRDALYELRDTVASKGVPLVVFIYPSHLSMGRDETPDQISWLLDVGGQANIPTYSLLGPLEESRLAPDSLYLLPHDGHPSPTGYRVAAQYAANVLATHDAMMTACAPVRTNLHGQGGGFQDPGS